MPKLNKTTKTERPAKTGRVLPDVTTPAPAPAPTSGTVTPIGNGLVAWSDDDRKSTTIDADKKTVTVVRAVRFAENGPQYKLVHTFDFADATFGEIAELATATLVIDVQREIRASKSMPTAGMSNVHERVNRDRASTTRDPVRAMATAATKLTPAQLAEQIAILTALVNADNAAKSEPAKS